MLPTGVLVPLITPFTADDRVDTASLERLARDVLAGGAVGLVALGTTAEAATLTVDERATVLSVCARVADEHGVPLIVGCGSNDTAGSAKALAELPDGVAAALVPVPPFTRPTADGVLAHFAALAGPVPLIVYNVPYRTGLELTAETVLRLAGVPGVVGTKHSAGALDGETVTLMAERPAGFTVYGGDDVLISPLLAIGADGGILASAHLDTRGFADLVDAWHTGDVARARALGHRLARLAAALFAEPNPVVVKAVLHALGRIATPAVRLPLLPVSAAALARARAEIDLR
ncbi:4-hydroxy-tetrahydrodipicolinate synthase [Actinokineospora sp. NBRC 105648]|uniref:4-hydroxy-tetrahydrodipicolinate synthase n=1 Tax=Actinokineospora sp. NBRC 105648 TaxID=3032206 RepID=UPI0024A15030|nr:4-hydroxy-tetrahydrodipicolinate synthase [Actinokineospora sp. NBRC 105648]GLZ40208.1 4-hydroxy-tetrahydrodipicolinate synthase [Actinokineospora sp. NBRC 105648]